MQAGQQTIADYVSGAAASSPTYTYCYASYIDEPVMRAGGSGDRYFHRNQQYSVVALTNSAGNVTERYTYSAYGNTTFLGGNGDVLTSSEENNRYTYTGREWDRDLKRYHFRARIYDPLSGMFCSRDPIKNTRTLANLYSGAFAAKSALDPSGMDWVMPWNPQAEWWIGSNPFAPDPQFQVVHPSLPPPRNGAVPAYTRTRLRCQCKSSGPWARERTVVTPCGASGGSGSDNPETCCSNACSGLGSEWYVVHGGWSIVGAQPSTPPPSIPDAVLGSLSNQGACISKCMKDIHKHLFAVGAGFAATGVYYRGQQIVVSETITKVSRSVDAVRASRIINGREGCWWAKGIHRELTIKHRWVHKYRRIHRIKPNALMRRNWIIRRGLVIGLKYGAIAELHLLNYCTWKCGAK